MAGQSRSVLPRLISALRPGGWIVAEEIDFVSAVADPRMGPEAGALFERAVQEHNSLLAAQHRFDPFYGRRVAGDLADAGLSEVGCEGRTTMWSGGEAGGRIWRLTLSQLREPMVAAGRMTAAEIDEVMALCDDQRLSTLAPIVMAAWGRRDHATGVSRQSNHQAIDFTGTPNGTRTRVSAVKGRRPRPLDDGRATKRLIVRKFVGGNPPPLLRAAIFSARRQGWRERRLPRAGN